MSKSIFRYFCGVLLISLIICSGLSMTILSNQMLKNTQKEMLFSIKLLDYQLDYNGDLNQQIDALNPLTYDDNTRLTIIDETGKVLADTDRHSSENHLERTEVQEALKSGSGYANRYSKTVKKNMLYVTYYNNHHVVRLAIPYNGVMDTISTLLFPFTISVLVSLLIAAFFTRKLAHRLSKPVLEISNEVAKMNQRVEMKFNEYEYEEYNIVANAIVSQARQLQDTMNRLQLEKIKINSILDQMNEGFILLDDTLSILMVNQQARQLFSRDMHKHTNIKDYIYDLHILEALDNVAMQPQSIDVKIEKLIYSCFVTKVDYGVTLLFVDVTAQRNAMKMRQEFFSNVSHELKTPMTSIKGYSELLQSGVISEETMKQNALEKIQDEVNNMSALINDILMISRLENKDIEVIQHPVMIQPIVSEIIDSVTPEAKKRNITLNNECDDSHYTCNHQHMHQLLNNLIANAVKYNVENGTVTIGGYIEESNMIITVSDTGIGIPLIDQQRVFERFYRCDKGRDKNSGGSGLGLAIVKHIVQYYKGTIDISSTLEKGTTITVVLPIITK